MGFSIVLCGTGEQLFITVGGDGWGVKCGETVPLWGESTRFRVEVNPGPGVVPAKPGNELKKFGDAI